jgi:hypothetical protein
MVLLRNSSAACLALILLTVTWASTQETETTTSATQEGVGQEVVPQQAAAQEATGEDPKPGAITHDTAGKMECLVCHAAGATPISDVPGDHESRGNETCMWCHATDSPMLTMVPSTTPHPMATAEMDCLACHAPGANESAGDVTESHEGRGNETCLWCHKKVEGFLESQGIS